MALEVGGLGLVEDALLDEVRALLRVGPRRPDVVVGVRVVVLDRLAQLLGRVGGVRLDEAGLLGVVAQVRLVPGVDGAVTERVVVLGDLRLRPDRSASHPASCDALFGGDLRVRLDQAARLQPTLDGVVAPEAAQVRAGQSHRRRTGTSCRARRSSCARRGRGAHRATWPSCP